MPFNDFHAVEQFTDKKDVIYVKVYGNEITNVVRIIEHNDAMFKRIYDGYNDHYVLVSNYDGNKREYGLSIDNKTLESLQKEQELLLSDVKVGINVKEQKIYYSEIARLFTVEMKSINFSSKVRTIPKEVVDDYFNKRNGHIEKIAGEKNSDANKNIAKLQKKVSNGTSHENTKSQDKITNKILNTDSRYWKRFHRCIINSVCGIVYIYKNELEDRDENYVFMDKYSGHLSFSQTPDCYIVIASNNADVNKRCKLMSIDEETARMVRGNRNPLDVMVSIYNNHIESCFEYQNVISDSFNKPAVDPVLEKRIREIVTSEINRLNVKITE